MKYRPLPVFFLLTVFAGVSFSQSRVVDVLTLTSTIDPISARYVIRGLDRARRDDAQLAVIELDTPGGLGSSMEQIVARILASEVPVAVFVAPQGARAASAGVFIAMAAHVAAMAPGTHIGAAHPVDQGGGDIEGAMGDKILNDTVAYLKSLAHLRGRSETWADDAVRRSVSLTETEAVAGHIADLVAPSLGDLMAALDGRTVKAGDATRVLHTAAAEVHRVPMNIIDRVLGIVVNPDIAYILLVVGILAVIFELTSPGAIAPGVAGAIALLIAFISFGSLPTNVGGVVFIVLSVVLFIVDIKAPTHGFLTAAGVVAFVLGSLLLFPPWNAGSSVPAAGGSRGTPGVPVPAVGIAPVTIVLMTILVVAFFVFVLTMGIRAQARTISFGAETIVGGAATALTDLGPEGLVRMGGEQWSALSEEGGIMAGEKVEIVGRDGLRLRVRRASKQGGAS